MHPLNAYELILVTLSGRTISLSCVQPSNACEEIDVTFPSIFTDTRDLQFLNTEPLIAVTLAGNTISVNALPSNAPVLMLLRDLGGVMVEILVAS